MSRRPQHPLLLLLFVLALALAACNGDGAATDDDEETPTTEESPAPGDGDGAAAMPLDEADLTPAEGETLLDVLGAREAPATETEEEATEEAAAEEEATEAAAEPTYSTLVEAIEAADLNELFESEGPWTVFAPTDEAFALYPDDSFEALLDDQERLRRVLAHHVVEGEVGSDQLSADETLETLAGTEIRVQESEGGDLLIDGAGPVETDVQADNGLVHGISSLLLPPA